MDDADDLGLTGLTGLTRRATATRWLTISMMVIGLAAVVTTAVLWPTGPAPSLGVQLRTYVDATVTDVRQDTCTAVEVVDALNGCRIVSVELSSGNRAGDAAELSILETQFEVPDIAVGDEIVLLDAPGTPEEFRYTFVDFQRGAPMVAIGILFVLVVLLFGRGKGLRALLGLLAGAAVLVVFIVPALIRDEPAVPVAIAGTVLVAFGALYLAHGFDTGTTVALAGTLGSLAVIATLSQIVASVAHLTGLAQEDAQVLRVTASDVDLRGLLLAGVIVGALGVLDDVTVTQVSTVRALLRARPDMPRRALYHEASEVGRDHIASTINTLVLAYAGAAIPWLLVFAEGTASIGRNLTSEVVAVEIVRMMVGSIGLVVSVPITTALAAAVLEAPADDEHIGHVH